MRKIICLLFIILSLKAKPQVSIDTAVNFTGKTPSGETITLFPLLEEGKTVMIYFFSDACSTCHLYANAIDTVYDKYGQNQADLFVMAVNKDVDNAGVTEFGNEYNWEFPYLSGTQGNGYYILHDLYGVGATPTTILIRPDKSIPWDNIYPAQVDTLSYYIESLGIFPAGKKTQLTNGNIRIYPNPAHQKVVIDSKFPIDRIQLYDMSGVRLLERTISSEKMQLDVGHFGKGVYLLRLEAEDGTSFGCRLLIQ